MFQNKKARYLGISVEGVTLLAKNKARLQWKVAVAGVDWSGLLMHNMAL